MSGLELSGLRTERAGFRLGPVDVSTPSGSATVILGPSGAGKTTLLRAVAGFLPLTGGSVRLEGEEISRAAPEARGFGFVPPGLGLFPHLRVAENVRYPLRLEGAADADPRSAEWLRRFDLERLAHRYPSELSSGERQRVAMARALAAEPRALLWDEPLAALDLESRDLILRLVRDLLETRAIPLLLVTHDPSTAAALAGQYLRLDRGSTGFVGTPDALLGGPLDRFTARFLGYENLYTAPELGAGPDSMFAAALRSAAGPGGVVVPPDAVRWGAASGGTSARVVGVRAVPGGWSIAARAGSLTVRVPVAAALPGVRVGDAVSLDVDPAKLRPLEDRAAGGR